MSHNMVMVSWNYIWPYLQLPGSDWLKKVIISKYVVYCHNQHDQTRKVIEH